MSTKNPWLTPLQRSYYSIRARLIASMKERIPEINDFSEGNIFVILLSMYAAVAEVLHYYIDNMAREAFLPTARKYSSVHNHAKLVDYHIKCAVPATVDIILYRDNPSPNDLVIPLTTFRSTDGKEWQSTKEVVIPTGAKSVKVSLSQIESNSASQTLQYLASDTPSVSLKSSNNDKRYAEGSMVLSVNGELWTLVDTFAYSGPNDKVFKVEPDNTLTPVILFGDGRFGKKPPVNSQIVASFKLTYGAKGNVPAGSFTEVPSSISNLDLKISSPYAANGGSDYEDFEAIKSHIPLSLKSLGVAITKDDYESITKLVPGVNKAYVNYRCGKYIEIYITPDNPTPPTDQTDQGWGQASDALINMVKDRVDKSKVITTNILVGSTHAARIYIDAEITGKTSYSSTDISEQVKSALLEAYNYNTSDINKPIRLSDLYAIIDGLSTVDYLKIHKLYLLPYPRPHSQGQLELQIPYYNQYTFNSRSDSITYEELTVVFTDPQNYQIRSKDSITSGKIGEIVKVTTNTSSFDIMVDGEGYEPDQAYSLYIQPMNTDLVPQNYNIPIFLNNTINLTINEVV